MNWKARALATQELGEDKLMTIVARGKPLNYNDGLALIGMLIRARGDKVDGVKDALPAPAQKKTPPPMPLEGSLGDLVSSEDNKTPWLTVLERMKEDDRLEMAVKDGLIHPVPKPV